MSASNATIELLWIPLGAGQHVVRICGRAFERLASTVGRRERCDLYHSALIVDGEAPVVIEMAPVADRRGGGPGVVSSGPVGVGWLGRSRWFRYEIRRWAGGVIPDAVHAVRVDRIEVDAATAERLLDLVDAVPTPVWGRDELAAGEMWNSNSVISWLLSSVGIDVAAHGPPTGGRAPGWDAGIAVAARSTPRER